MGWSRGEGWAWGLFPGPKVTGQPTGAQEELHMIASEQVKFSFGGIVGAGRDPGSRDQGCSVSQAVAFGDVQGRAVANGVDGYDL